MKQIKNYDDFKTLHENVLNENIFTNIWKKVVSAYEKLKEKFGIHAWSEYNKKLEVDDMLPKGVEIYDPSGVNEAATVPLTAHDREMHNEDADGLIREITEAYEMRVDTGEMQSLFIWGGPGIGKTDIVKQVCKKLDVKLIVFHLSQIDSTDFRGLPIILDIEVTEEMEASFKSINKDLLKQSGGSKKGSEKKIIQRSGTALPLVFPTSNGTNGKGGILFLDEMNLAIPLVLNAAMPLALDGSYEGYDLPDKWIIIAAGNRRDDVPDSIIAEIRGALGNRFFHLNYVPTVEGWTEWAKEKDFMDPMLIGFLNFKKKWFHYLEGDLEQSSAWPSPRSWSAASFVAHYRTKKRKVDLFKLSDSEQMAVYTMSVGYSAASAFAQYEKLVSIISEKDIQDIYKTGKTKKKMPVAPDELHAVLNAIAYYKTGTKLTPKELENLFVFSENLASFEYTSSFMAAVKGAHMKPDGYCYYHHDKGLKEVFEKHLEIWYDRYEKMTNGEESEI